MATNRIKLSDLSDKDRQLIMSGRSKANSRNGNASKAGEKQSKHRNIKTTVDAIVFDSRLEAKRYSILRLLEKSGTIKDLKLQESFDIIVNGEKICSYKADFVYMNSKDEMVVEDAKGTRTPVYKLKKKLMKAVLGIDIKEVFRENVSDYFE